MAAGLSKKQISSRVYNKLKAVQYKLERAGVPTTYRGGQLFPQTNGMQHGHGFNISASLSRASNGECAIFFNILIAHECESMEHYGWLKPDGNFTQGIERIIELFVTLPEVIEAQSIMGRMGVRA